MFPLSSLMKKFVTTGTLNVIDADGMKHVFAGKEGPEVTIRLHDKSLYRKLTFSPEMTTGEAYMDGTLTFENGSTLKDFLHFFKMNGEGLGSHPLQKVLRSFSKTFRRFQQSNKKGQVQKHVAHHYDLGNEFFKLFLDEQMVYTCAYFRNDDETLEQAQRNKLRLAVTKLDLKPGHKVLDIGCGWGDLALYMASIADVKVVGVTLSVEQQKLATERAKKAGLDDRVEFRLQDYRDVDEKFDRIISIGMFEQVGIQHFDEFFKQLNHLMPDDGITLLHSIGHMSPPGTTSPWFRKYIFPNGYSPSLSEVYEALERNNLWVLDMENLRLHYSKTLIHWHERFVANRHKVVEMYDERFARMWEFYLQSAEMVFSTGPNFVFHMQLSRKRDATPITRDYMVDAQRELEKLEKTLDLNF
jgi:cyclopropane-fatty-acyl-phospholipid synthase